jgi:D-alanyl-D-alanine carboxypeptidase (penicillin-binding protein 5/6)
MALRSNALAQMSAVVAALLVAAGAFAIAAPRHAVKPTKPVAAPVAQKKEPLRNKDEPLINAPHAILIDAENGGVLYEHDPDKLIFPASLAKLMTAEYVFHEIREGRIKLTDQYIVSENAWRKGGAPSHGSTMFAALNSKVSVDDLLHGMIIVSGNDACIVLAEGISSNEDEFAAALTKRAREIGLQKSTFANSNGLPNPGTKVTTRELAMLARHIILEYPDLYKIFGQVDYTWNRIRQPNRNPLLAMVNGADGLKTGFTNEAGYGLVGSAVQDGLRLIVVVNGEKSAKERGDEAKKLLEWGFRSFEHRKLFAEGQIIGSAKVYGGASGSVPLKAVGLVQMMVPKSGGEKLVARIAYQGPVPAPVALDQQIGVLKVWRDDKLVLQVPLKAAESVAKGNLSQRAIDAVTEMVIALFRAGAERL